ncbi:MAG: hypothetical protein ACYDA9_12460 [Terriglobia bacterium]
MAKTLQVRHSSPDTGDRGLLSRHQKSVSLSLSSLMRPTTFEKVREILKNPKYQEISKLAHAARVRQFYKWSWGAGAEYLYRELIRALSLKHHEEELMRLAKPKPGRRLERELAERIWSLRAEGRTVRQIQAELERDGRSISKEAVESYLKTRRRKKQP